MKNAGDPTMGNPSGEPCDHDGRDCAYGAADKANAALQQEMTKFTGAGGGSVPKADPASLKENSRGDKPDDSKSNNFGVVGHGPQGRGAYNQGSPA